ncbi:hypothetical protein IKG06_01260 [Candidatus Saccharibacteria bacterium]|nr:hypothetical protein [Candidatus Saccharibacteria bacterium]
MTTKKNTKSKQAKTKSKSETAPQPFRKTVKESIIIGAIILVCGCALAIGAYLLFAPR